MGKGKNTGQNVVNQAQAAYNRANSGPSDWEREFTPWSQGFYNSAVDARNRDMGTNTRLMNQFGGMYDEMSGRAPTKFNWTNVSAQRPAELTKAYGYLDEAMPGYRDFASTGGYSAKDIQELRARGINPIRSAYSGAIRDIDRANVTGGGSANYIAARSKAQRELPGQMADAMTNVNAGLADAIRQGKMFGLSGITQTGSTMGGLSSDEAGRMLQAALANSGGKLQAAGMTEGALQNWYGNRMSALGAQANLYGTTPGMSALFGNQALQGAGIRSNLEGQRQSYMNNLLQLQLAGAQQAGQNQPWWKKALGFAGDAAGMFIGAGGIPGLKKLF